ncbi:DegT/DnrJ/EryC1/StrS family aminotransferase [Singulisphaera sp. PoT]|uniref:DegT/DnrJ/EryC1/StrS family aminotransferase n=1 Tax=Singulisphaera sp. PoT TaxID=3411797 RepID=UPI003BF4FCA1
MNERVTTGMESSNVLIPPPGRESAGQGGRARVIPFSKVVCDGNELAYIREVLESGWLTTASKTKAFEEKFSEVVGARYCCAVNSCTSALHLGLEALGVGPGDKVLVPTMTFTASAEVIRYLGAEPIFLDVDFGTALLTEAIVEEALDAHPEAKVLTVVHFGGQAAAMLDGERGGILALCRQRGVRVIEDAAHAFPAREGGRPVGSLGDVTCFSFYANKTITTGEGGMLTTDDPEIAERVRVMRLHGIDRDIWKRFISEYPMWEYDVIAPGYKYNMPDLNAAIGLAQLERADVLRDARERCARYYFDVLGDRADLDLPVIRVPFADHAWHLFWIVVQPETVGRNRLIELLSQRGIGTSVHYKPLHRMKYYRERYELDPGRFPGAERLWRGCLSLPLYPSLCDDDLRYITDSLVDCLG